MKKALTYLFITLSAVLILDSLNFGAALLLFLTVGVVPGTDLIMTPNQMLEFFALLAGITLGRVSARLVSSALLPTFATHRQA